MSIKHAPLCHRPEVTRRTRDLEVPSNGLFIPLSTAFYLAYL